MPHMPSAPSRSTEPARNGLRSSDNGTNGDEDWVELVTHAMQLAAKRAHLVAHQTGTGVLYRRADGAVGVFKPDPAMYEELIPPPFEDEQILRVES